MTRELAIFIAIVFLAVFFVLVAIEERRMIKIYRCKKCGKQYVEDYLPMVDGVVGCCKKDSLILEKEI